MICQIHFKHTSTVLHSIVQSRLSYENYSHERVLGRDAESYHLGSKQEVSFVFRQNRLKSNSLALTNILQSWSEFMFVPYLLSWSLRSSTVFLRCPVNSVHTSSVDQPGRRSLICFQDLFIGVRYTKVLINLFKRFIVI